MTLTKSLTMTRIATVTTVPEEILESIARLSKTLEAFSARYYALREEFVSRIRLFPKYIDPEAVEDLMPKFVRGSVADTLGAIYNYIVSNLKYCPDPCIPLPPKDLLRGSIEYVCNYVKSPRDTLRDGCGDCEDLAFLAASMAAAYYKYILKVEEPPVMVVVVSGESPKGAAQHAFTLIRVKDKAMIVNPAGYHITGKTLLIFRQVQLLPIEEALKKYLEHWEKHEKIKWTTLEYIVTPTKTIPFHQPIQTLTEWWHKTKQ